MRTLQCDVAIGVLVGNFGDGNAIRDFLKLNMVADGKTLVEFGQCHGGFLKKKIRRALSLLIKLFASAKL
jgi:hypothetical protein